MLAVLCLCIAAQGCKGPGESGPPIPEGFELVYAQDFDNASAVVDFVASDPDAWRVVLGRGEGQLELHAPSQYQPTYRSPLSMAVLVGPIVSSFVLDAEVLQTGREYAHRDLCLFFGVQDPDHYYYVHLSSSADDNAHQIFIVDGAERRPITVARTFGVDWGRDTWHRVRLVRDAVNEQIVVFFDEDPHPVMRARDGTFGAGWVGLGSFDDTGSFDNLRLYSNEFELRSPEFFSQVESVR